jgi:hypothetical protein
MSPSFLLKILYYPCMGILRNCLFWLLFALQDQLVTDTDSTEDVHIWAKSLLSLHLQPMKATVLAKTLSYILSFHWVHSITVMFTDKSLPFFLTFFIM